MNPFRIKREELNVEKTDSEEPYHADMERKCKELSLRRRKDLLSKSSQNTMMSISTASTALPTPTKTSERIVIDDRNKNVNSRETENERMARIEAQIDEIENAGNNFL